MGGVYGRVKKENLGHCYSLAARRVVFGPCEAPKSEGYVGAELVHGTIEGFGHPPLDHAWVEEPDGEIWEPATATLYDVDDFERLFHPVELCRYSVKQAAHMMARRKHFGPWEDDQ